MTKNLMDLLAPQMLTRKALSQSTLEIKEGSLCRIRFLNILTF